MFQISPGLGAFLVLVALVIIVLFARFRSRQRRSGTKDAATWHLHSDAENAGQPARDDPSAPGHSPDPAGSDGDGDGPN